MGDPVTRQQLGERMRVLGIDPGLTRCGLGVVDGVPGRQPLLVAVDVVRTPSDLDIVTVPADAAGGLRELVPAALLPAVPEGPLVKFHVQVSVVIDCGGGCHVVAGPAGSVRVREPVIDVVVTTSSAAGKVHSCIE